MLVYRDPTYKKRVGQKIFLIFIPEKFFLVTNIL